MIFSFRNSQSPGVSEVHSLCQLWQSWWYWIQCSYDIAQTVMEYKILIFEWHIYLFSSFSLDYDAMPHAYIDFYFSSLKLLSRIIIKKIIFFMMIKNHLTSTPSVIGLNKSIYMKIWRKNRNLTLVYLFKASREQYINNKYDLWIIGCHKLTISSNHTSYYLGGPAISPLKLKALASLISTGTIFPFRSA